MPAARCLPLLLALAAGFGAASAEGAEWRRLPLLSDISYEGALDLSDEVRQAPVPIALPWSVRLGGGSWDHLLVGEGFVHLAAANPGSDRDLIDRQSPDGPPGTRAGSVLGPRLDLLSGPRVRVPAGAPVLLDLASELVALRFTALRSPTSQGAATVELLLRPSGVEVQYLHVPPGFGTVVLTERGSPPASASAYALDAADEAFIGGPVRTLLPVPFSDDPPPDDCDPEAGDWCDFTGANCTPNVGQPGPQGPVTDCDERVSDLWRFWENDFCKDCPYVFYILVECGREMHIPTYDMEGLDLEITNMVTGLKPDLRCVNQTAMGEGPSVSWQFPPNCGPGSGPWWSPALDVTNNVGPGHVRFSDSSPNDGFCNTRYSVGCGELPPSGAAPTVVYGEEQTIDCYIQNETGLCGIYRVEIISGGNGWELFANCDGTNTPQFDIYFDCTEAWAAYNPLPELAIANVSATGDCYTYDIAFDVQNLGCVDHLDDVPVLITSDCGDELPIWVPGPVPATGSVSWVQPFTLSCPDGTITFTVDPNDEVAECTESPNAAACTQEGGVDTLDYDVVCCPIVDAGPDEETCAGEPVDLIFAATTYADEFLWDDGGAGGAFSPGADVRNPSYTPPEPSPGAITLTLAGTFSGSGCTREDSLLLTVHPLPEVDAGPDASACASEPLALDGASSDADGFAWDDGGAGGLFTPSASVLQPEYSNDTAGTYTLTLVATQSTTGCESTDSVEVEVLPLPLVEAGANLEACAGEEADLAEADGGTADTYLWDDGGAGGTFTPSADVQNPAYSHPAAGTYLLSFTATESGTGCASSDELELLVHANPAADAGADKAACIGEAIELADATPDTADTFSWDDGGAGGTFSPSADVLNPTWEGGPVGSHVLTLTATNSATGCVTVDTLEAVVHPEPVVAAGSDKTGCASADILLDDADGGAGDVFLWIDNGAGGSFSPNPRVENPSYSNPRAGFYTLTFTATVSATGCEASDSLEVEVDAQPVVEAGSDKSACEGADRLLDDAYASGGSDVSWDDGGAGGTFSPSATVLEPSYRNDTPGTYTLTLTAVKPATGCEASDSFEMTVTALPTVDAGPDETACQGEAAVLDGASASGTSYRWDDGGAGGSFSPSATVLAPSYSNASAGVFTLTLLTTDDEGCQDSDSLQATVVALPSVEAGADREACVGAPVALDDASSSGDQYSWDDGGAGGSFSPSASVLNPSYSNPARGSYTLTLTATRSDFGCLSSDTLGVVVRDQPTAGFGVPGGPWCEDTQVCFTNSSDDATEWLWEFGDPAGSTSASFEPCFVYSEPGTYTVSQTATNSCGSDLAEQTITIDPKPVAAFSYSTQGNRFCKEKDVDFVDESTNAPTSWQWDFGDGNGSTQQNPVHAYDSDGLFVVSLVACNDCGCSPPAYDTVEIFPSCQTNCEANSNQIDCDGGVPATQTGDTCLDSDNFNNGSYPCATGNDYSGPNKTYDLNFAAGANFIITLVETEPEPNGYELDLILSDRCNPPNCIAWGDDTLVFSDRTAANDDYFLIVDGRDGSCGPYELTVECLAPDEAASCAPPSFTGLDQASDPDPCRISGVLVEWTEVADWGLDRDGLACNDGVYEIWRAPASDPGAARRVGTAVAGETMFLDLGAVPRRDYEYFVHAVNLCCGEPALADPPRADGRDEFGNAIEVEAGPGGTLTCDEPEVGLAGSASGGTGAGFSYLWSPAEGLSDPAVSNPVATLPGIYTLTATDLEDGCTGTDTVEVVGDQEDPVADAGPARELTCDVSEVVLEGGATGGNGSQGYSYLWSPAGPLDDETSRTPRTQTEGSYELTVTDLATGCVGTDTVVVTRNDTPPEASAGPNRELTCAVLEVTLDGSASGGDGSEGYSYAWSPAAGVSDATSPTPTTTMEGRYTLTVTDLHTGCRDTDVTLVVRNDTPPVASAGPDRQLDCEAAPVTLNGGALGGDGSQGYGYAWSPADAVSDPNVEDPTTQVPGSYTLTVTDLATGCTDEDTVEVTADPDAPQAEAGADQSITCLVSTVTLSGSASGGDDSQGYTYAWSPAADVTDPAAATTDTSTPGVYTLTVTSVADGCVGVDAVTVEDLTGAPTAEAGPARVLTCTETSVTLEGSAGGSDGRDGYSYAWEPAADVSDPASATPTTSSEGTYTLTVTDLFTGCADTDTVEVSRDEAAPAAEAGPGRTLTCSTTEVTLDGSASGGNGSEGYSYSWDPSGPLDDPASPTPIASAAGTYTLTVTDLANGCTDTDTVVVDEDLAAPTADAGADQVLDCSADSVTLTGSASGGNGSAGYSYRWEPAGAVSDPDAAVTEATASGTYTLTVTDLANGCTGSDTVEVTSSETPPVADAGPDDAITCDETSADLTGSGSGGDGSQGYLAEWSPTDGVVDPTAFETTTTLPGVYTLVVEDVATGCRSLDTMEVVDDTEPPTAEAGPAKSLTCDDDPVTLEGSASGGNDSQGYTYAWEPADRVSDPGAAAPTTDRSGTYTLTVTSVANGCAAEDSVVVTDRRAPPVSDAGPDQTRDCRFGTVTLTGSARGGDGSMGYAYAWEPAGQVSDPASPTPTTSTAGTYTLTVTDLATGCTDDDLVEVLDDFAEPVAEAGPDKTLTCDDTIVQLEGSASGGNGSEGYDYHWEPEEDVSNPAAATPVALAPGIYTLTVTSRANGCSGTDTVEVLDDSEAPVAEAGPDRRLDCAVTEVSLDGSASGGNDSLGYLYEWEPAGEVSDPSAPAPTTSTPGTFSLTVTAISTGCAHTDTVLVTRDIAQPTAEAGPNSILDCVDTAGNLSGSASGGNGSQGYSYSWSPTLGVADPAAAQTTTTEPGVYTLTVTSVDNGCSDSDSTEVFADQEPPVADAGTDRVLECGQESVGLSGSASGGNGSEGYSYEWSPAELVSDPNVANPDAQAAGSYVLTVTDLANGCTDLDTVEVLADPDEPVASAGPDQRIDCDDPVVVLEGSASGGDDSQGYSYAWAPAEDVSNPSAAQPTTMVAGTYTLTVTTVADGCTDVDTVTVTMDVETPVASAGPDRHVDCTNPVVGLDGSASGGDDSEGYLYSWSPTAGLSDPAAPNPTTSSAGTYTLTVTTVATGCADSDTVEVTADTAEPSASAGPDQTLDCETSEVVLQGAASGGNGSLGYGYAWEPAGDVSDPASAQPTTSVPGTYTLTVTDLANGCTAVDQVVVDEDVAAPTADAGEDQVLDCGGPNVTLTGSASGGNGSAGYSYRWEPAGGVTDPDSAVTESDAAGTYTLTVTDLANGCTGTDTVEVTSSQEPPVADAGPDDSITCTDGVADLQGSASGGDGSQGYAVEWSPAAGVADPNALVTTTTEPGTYTLLVEDIATGCRSTDSMVVVDDRDPPVAEAGPARVLSCDVTLVTLAGSASGGNGSQGYEYAWSPPGDVSDPAAAQPTTSLPGTYTLTVTDLANGCVGSDVVVVSEDLAEPVAEAGPDRFLGCNGAVTLQGSASGGNGSAGYAYSWEPAGEVSDPAAAQPTTSTLGTFTLTVTDLANGCIHQDQVEVVDDATPPVAEAGPDGTISCTDASVVLQGSASGGNGSEGYSYAWTPAAGLDDPAAAQPTASAAGTYTLTVTDLANGCTGTDTVTVSEDLAEPVADAGEDQELDCRDASVTLTGSASGGNGSAGYSYRWEPAGGVTDPDAPVTEASAAGIYTLTVTDLANGCADSDTVEVLSTQDPPVANAGVDAVLGCDDVTAPLQGSASGGDGRQGYTAAWSPTAGVANPNSFVTTTTEAAVYTLLVTDVYTGCTSVDTMEVIDDTTDPVADAGGDQRVTCLVSTVTLTGTGSGGNGSQGYDYRWEPAALVSAPNSPVTTTSSIGVFTLTVTDRANDCASQDTVEVIEDRERPVADAGPDQTLSCVVGTVTLMGSASGGNGSEGYEYFWSPQGAVSDPTAAQPTTSEVGIFRLTVTDVANGCSHSDVMVVRDSFDAPIAQAGPARQLDCANSSVVLLGSASGGDGSQGYAYSWEPAGLVSDPNEAQPTTSTAGEYTLTVTDVASGCVGVDLVMVTENYLEPVANAGPDKTLTCAELSVRLEGSAFGGDGSAGYSYRWEPAEDVSNADTARPFAFTPGIYTLTVTDLANGCTGTDTVEVDEDRAAPIAEAGPDLALTCTEGVVVLEGSAAGGNGSAGYSYLWSPATGLSDPALARPEGTEPGTFTLTVTDLANGCTATDVAVITADREPPVADAGPDVVLDCALPSVTLAGSASGGNGSLGYSFAWEPAGSVSDPSSAVTEAFASGSYVLTVTDLANGCTHEDIVEVGSSDEPPVAEAGPDGAITCRDPMAPLVGEASGGDGSQGYAAQWSPTAGVADPNALVTSTTVPGEYTLVVVDVATGCRSTDFVTIAEDLAPPLAEAGPTLRLTCLEPVVALQGAASGGNGTLGYSFAWEPAADVSNPSAPDPTVSRAGRYTLTVTDLANGCTAVDEVLVEQDIAAPVADAGSGSTLTCNRPFAPLNGSASGGNGTLGYSYRWEPAGDVLNPDVASTQALQAGTYTLIVTDLANGCAGLDTVLIGIGLDVPIADAGPDLAISCGQPARLRGSASGGDGSLGYSYRWEPAANVGDPNAAETTTTIAGNYTLEVTALATGCSGFDIVTVTTVPPAVPREPSALDLAPGVEPLRVERDLAAPFTTLSITWEPVVGADGFALYQGTIAGLRTSGYDHAPLACGLASPRSVFVPDDGNLYYLATTANCDGDESSYGRASTGAERPDAALASGLSCP